MPGRFGPTHTGGKPVRLRRTSMRRHVKYVLSSFAATLFMAGVG
jgi:hypothetical protein